MVVVDDLRAEAVVGTGVVNPGVVCVDGGESLMMVIVVVNGKFCKQWLG
jgi:hypothetical protein